MKVGVFVCHCGSNIAGTVDVENVAGATGEINQVRVSKDYKYMCSEPGQEMIINAIKENNLDRVVVAACSPKLHERTFQRCLQNAGLNPYMLEMANIREHCSWVHPNEPATTEKAKDIVRLYVGKVAKGTPLYKNKIPVEKRALIIGGGVAGMEAALNIGSSGYRVVLVEKEDQLGGLVKNYRYTFPAFDETNPVHEKARQIEKNPNIEVFTQSEVKKLSGYVGNFHAEIKDLASGNISEEKAGAILVATGMNIMGKNGFHAGNKVLNSLEFEQRLKGGLLNGKNGKKKVNKIAFIQCSGSRDPQGSNGVSYCSRICCMYTAKQAYLFTRENPEGQVYIFYHDLVAVGKNHEEFINHVRRHDRVLYLKGKVKGIKEQDDRVNISGEDLLSGENVEVDADLVVEATPLMAREDSTAVGQMLGIPYDQNHFFSEQHVKLAPVETVTNGIYLAGACQSPRDITDAITSASAASAKILGLFSKKEYEAEPITARVDASKCNGCFDCSEVCTFNAIEKKETKNGKVVANVIESMCQGCGNCVSSCRPGAMDLAGFSNEQIMNQIAYAAS